MRTKIHWLLLGWADAFTDIGFARPPGIVAKVYLSIADACDRVALAVAQGEQK